MGTRISNIGSHRKIVEHILSITPLLLSLQSPRPSSNQKIVIEDRVAQLCIGEQKHERPWNIRDAARERASAGKDEVALALPPGRPERRGQQLCLRARGCSVTGGARGGPLALPLAGGGGPPRAISGQRGRALRAP
jgi:hypothetical protein